MTDINEVITDLEHVNPSPIDPRICKCACARLFQPRRSDQLYINKKHADKDYHEKVRKPNQINQRVIEKHMRSNNKICEKYFNTTHGNEAICLLEALKADGFNSSYLLGHILLKGDKYFMTYNYLMHFFLDDGIKKVKIRKQ